MQSSADHDINLDNIESNVKEVISPETNILTLEDVIKHFPKRMQTRAQLLGSYLKKDGQNMWSDKGELLYNNEPILGTSITDLLYDACCPKRKYEPKGVKIFYHILSSNNLPAGLIRNQDRHKWLEDNKSSIFLKGWQEY